MPAHAEPDRRLRGLVEAAHAVQPRTVALRRRLHRHPELGLQLPMTRSAVLDELAGLPLRIHPGTSCSSVVAVLDGERPGPTVLLRGDMDALPLTEDTGLPYASKIEGSMHACGHDTHTAMLASAARLLSERRELLAGRVLLMFQPGEEGDHGARQMIQEGVLDAAGPAGTPSAAYALHISSTMPSGSVQTRPGAIMAAADVLRVTVHGRGGHASAPHDALDPIPPAAAMVGALQTMITRRVSALDPAVLTIAQIRAGTTSNVIPESAYLEGTLRTLSERTRRQLHEQLRQVCQYTAATYGCTAHVEIDSGYPIVVNDPDAAARVDQLSNEVLGRGRSTPMDSPILGAEDFAYVLNRVPGALAFLGGCPPHLSPESAPPNHSNKVIFDESAMVDGVALYTAFALDALS
ncbi:M20 metallopeptidase family protein [Pseudonocardia spinosispora]|uniref:M20 metallopeptidase family protein n=1 Tax=Pseudonocardia spinosispora TaxID=103441 RepID=UPI00041E5A6D|nr:M20 family metallopeptidase [Pseudonocardia spinosispora]